MHDTRTNMKEALFITGNTDKAAYFSKLIGHEIAHTKIDLPEIQSLDTKEIVDTKLEAAYEHVGQPVIVEDVSLSFDALGKLPGTFIKFFLDELSHEQICALVPSTHRAATVHCVFGYFDGKQKVFFERFTKGMVPEKPATSGGFGWDRIFIPEGYAVTRAELSPEDDKKTYLQIKPIDEVRSFLQAQN